MNLLIKSFSSLAGALALSCVCATSQAASPYTCSDPIYGINGSGGYGNTYTSESCINGHTANSSSTVVVAPLVAHTAANNVNALIMTRLQQLSNSPAGTTLAANEDENHTGYAAGNANKGWGLWLNGTYSDVRNTFAETATTGDISTVMLGIDTYVDSWNALFGIALGWENQDLNTHFNQGYQDGDGWSVMPYLQFTLYENWSLALLGGYTWLDYDLSRRDPSSGAEFVGSADAGRYYGSIDLLHHKKWDNWRLNGQIGLYYAEEKRDDYIETGPQIVAQQEVTSKLGRFRFGGSAGYLFANQYEPYLRALFLWDFDQDEINVAPIQGLPSNDDSGMIFGGGINIFVAENVSLNFDAHTELTRENYETWGVSGKLLIKFQ